MEAKKTPVIGLPRAMLYFRYRTLWHAFFDELGIQTVVSGPTDRAVLEQGSARAIDEACLSLKIYLGHVEALCGKCDYILVPRVSSFGRHRNMCTRFEALPDLVKNIFRESGQKFLSYDLDVLQKKDEASAFQALGQTLGCSPRAVRKAYKAAEKTEQAQYKGLVREQEQLYRAEGLKILSQGRGRHPHPRRPGGPGRRSPAQPGAVPHLQVGDQPGDCGQHRHALRQGGRHHPAQRLPLRTGFHGQRTHRPPGKAGAHAEPGAGQPERHGGHRDPAGELY